MTNLARELTRAVSGHTFEGFWERLLTFADGIGLACGIFEYLLSRKHPAKVIAATHFHEIFENNFLPRRPQLQLGHMEVQVSEETQEAEDQITYLYKYVPGTWEYDLLVMLTSETAFALGEATRALVPCISPNLLCSSVFLP